MIMVFCMIILFLVGLPAFDGICHKKAMTVNL